MEGVKMDCSDSSFGSSMMRLNEAKATMAEIRDILAIKGDENDELFPRRLSETLHVDRSVVSVMLSLEEMASMRKRSTLLQALNECKERIIYALEGCDEDENIPWGPDDDPSAMVKSRKSHHTLLPFSINPNADMTDEMERRRERSEFISGINRYVKSCEGKVRDMRELIEWMSNFSFEVTWEDVGMSPVQVREDAEKNSYKTFIQALQYAWQLSKRLKQLIEFLATDDTYDVISGKLPPHIAAARRKKKGGAPPRKIWCSNKLRGKFDEYEKTRIKMAEREKKSQNADAQPDATSSERQVTVVVPGQSSDAPKSAYKDTELAILKEVNRCWKDAVNDVTYFMQEVKDHKFTKKSCQLRLNRAMLLVEFITAAIEGKLIDGANKEQLLEDTKKHVVRLQEELSNLNTKLAEEKKATQAAHRKIGKLKRQLDLVTKTNQSLQARVVKLNEKISKQKEDIKELKNIPNQADFEEKIARIAELEGELNLLQEEIAEAKAELDERAYECKSLLMLLAQEKDMSASLSDDIKILEDENVKAQAQLVEMEQKMSENESNLMSLRLMVYYKDEVIRRLKQAAIELKSREKTRRVPKKPPPSPEEQTPKRSKDSLDSKSSGELKDSKESKVEVPQSEVQEAEKQAEKPEPEPSTVEQHGADAGDQVAIAERPPIQAPPVNVGHRLHEDSKKRRQTLQTTRVLVVTEDYKKLKKAHEQTVREVHATKEDLRQTRLDFDFKLKEGLETERHKSVIESMKTEEDLQFLCFTIKDETMRIQKEMRKFSDQLCNDLETIMGVKGLDLPNLMPKTGGRKTGGLATNVNMRFGPDADADSLMGEEMGRFPDMAAMMADPGMMMGGPNPMMFGQDMMGMGFPPQAGMGFPPQGGMGFAGMPGFGFGPEGGFPGQGPGGGGGGQGAPGEGVNYWKSLKTALTGKSVDAEEKRKENENMVEVSEVLAQRRKAREEKRKAIDEASRSSLQSFGKSAVSLASLLSKESLKPSTGRLRKLRRRRKLYPTPSAAAEDVTEIAKSASAKKKTTDDQEEKDTNETKESKIADERKTTPKKEGVTASERTETKEKREIEFGNENMSTPTVEKTTSESMVASQGASQNAEPQDQHPCHDNPNQRLPDNTQSVAQIDTEFGRSTQQMDKIDDEKESEDPAQRHVHKAITFVAQQTVRRGSLTGHGLLMERRRARFGDRRRSSVIPFRGPRISIDARRMTICEPTPAKKLKIRGFFGLGPAPASDVSIKRSVRTLPSPVKRMPQLPEEVPPLKQAEKFVRQISVQVTDFLGGVKAGLVDAMRKNKDIVESKLESMESELTQERMKYTAEISSMRREAEENLRELRYTKQILTDIGFGMGSSSKLGFRNILPQDLVQKLKESEADLDEAKKRLDSAAKSHQKNAEQYKVMSANLETKLQVAEIKNEKLSKNLRKEKSLSNELRVRLQETLKAQRQQLFMSLRHHKHNYDLIKNSEEVGAGIKKVALSLLRRSMLYPEIGLSLLVRQYCQHVTFTECQERVRIKIAEDEKSPDRNYLNRPRRPSREKELMTPFLAKLTMRKELARKRIEERRSRLASDRQKLLIKTALVLHKLKNDNVHLQLIQPSILQISGKGFERSHNNTPVEGERPDLRLILPKTQYVPLPPVVPLKTVHGPPSGDARGLLLRGGEPPREIDRIKALVPHWFPEDSLFCPFERRSGNVPPVNSDITIHRTSQKGSAFPRLAPANRYRNGVHRVEIPRIMELEVQSGLREAKKAVLRRLRAGTSSSTPSTVTGSSSSDYGAPATRHDITPASMASRYDWQNEHSPDSPLPINDIFSLRSPLPPIPSPPKLTKAKKTVATPDSDHSSPANNVKTPNSQRNTRLSPSSGGSDFRSSSTTTTSHHGVR